MEGEYMNKIEDINARPIIDRPGCPYIHYPTITAKYIGYIVVYPTL